MSQAMHANDGPAAEGFRMPAEWEPHTSTWMCWPCRLDPWGIAERLSRARGATSRVATAVAHFEPVILAVRPEDVSEAREACGPAVEIFEVALDDSWARDIGPSFLLGPGRAGVAWRFNAWGGKYEPYANDREFASRVLGCRRARSFAAPIVCEGGAIHVDGNGTLMTTEQCLLNPNRNPGRTREQIERALASHTAVERILWLPGHFSDEETDGHIDNIACFAAPGRVLLGVPPMRSHPDYEAVAAARRYLADMRDAQGRKFDIVDLVQPCNMRLDWREQPLAASYVNFYLANGGVVMPGFDDPADAAARAVLADCFPDRNVVQVEVLDIVQGGGGIHCITQQEPA
ncbi:MAG TPA: agmatine deiminase family protein [Rhizomicrobium sp.]|jgi:agmatine deiminase|nr:agmatine deiminase family protein [Rhizomicrobium sp.]